MLDTFLGHYAYWGAIVLLGVGLYAVTASGNLVKKVMGSRYSSPRSSCSTSR